VPEQVRTGKVIQLRDALGTEADWRRAAAEAAQANARILAAQRADEAERARTEQVPLLSPLNWLRLAAIRAGRDWRDLPAAIRIGGVQDPGEAAGAVLGHHSHDNAAGSLADPRLAHEPHRGAYGVVELAGAAPAVRGHQDVRQAPGAVVDARGWPVATHVLAVEGDELVLYGPAIDLTSKRPCLLVIETFVDDPTAERGVWHRPMTPRELFSLQDGDESFVVEARARARKRRRGSSSGSAT